MQSDVDTSDLDTPMLMWSEKLWHLHLRVEKLAQSDQKRNIHDANPRRVAYRLTSIVLIRG